MEFGVVQTWGAGTWEDLGLRSWALGVMAASTWVVGGGTVLAVLEGRAWGVSAVIAWAVSEAEVWEFWATRIWEAGTLEDWAPRN